MAIHQIFFYLLILFLPTQLGLHVWPEWSYILGRRVDYLSPTLFLTDILVILVLISWALNKRIKLKIQINYQKFFVTLFLIVFSILNISLATSKPVALYKWVKVLEYILLCWYIIKTKPSQNTVILVIAITIFYSSIIGISQFLIQHSIGGPLWIFGERSFFINTPGIARVRVCVPFFTQDCREWLRAYSTFPHPNVFAGFLVATLPLLFPLVPSPALWSRNMFYIATAVLGIVSFILTFSRSAWIVGLFVFFWIWSYKAVGKKMKILTLLIFIVLFPALLFAVFRFVPFDEETVGIRRDLTTAAMSLWPHSPLVGIGLGNFLVNLPGVLPSRAVYFLQPVHSIYLLLISEVGVIGFVTFLFVLWKMLRLHNFQKQVSQNYYLLTVVSLLLLGFVDKYLLNIKQGQHIFNKFIALSFCSWAKKEKDLSVS